MIPDLKQRLLSQQNDESEAMEITIEMARNPQAPGSAPVNADVNRFEDNSQTYTVHERILHTSRTTRRVKRLVPDNQKDNDYWQKRRKNNEAAKKSREVKRQLEMNIKQRLVLVEEENTMLKKELKTIKEYFKLSTEIVYTEVNQNGKLAGKKLSDVIPLFPLYEVPDDVTMMSECSSHPDDRLRGGQGYNSNDNEVLSPQQQTSVASDLNTEFSSQKIFTHSQHSNDGNQNSYPPRDITARMRERSVSPPQRPRYGIPPLGLAYCGSSTSSMSSLSSESSRSCYSRTSSTSSPVQNHSVEYPARSKASSPEMKQSSFTPSKPTTVVYMQDQIGHNHTNTCNDVLNNRMLDMQRNLDRHKMSISPPLLYSRGEDYAHQQKVPVYHSTGERGSTSFYKYVPTPVIHSPHHLGLVTEKQDPGSHAAAEKQSQEEVCSNKAKSYKPSGESFEELDGIAKEKILAYLEHQGINPVMSQRAEESRKDLRYVGSDLVQTVSRLSDELEKMKRRLSVD